MTMSNLGMVQAEARARRSMDRAAYDRSCRSFAARRCGWRDEFRQTSTEAAIAGYGSIGLMEAYQRSAEDMPDEEFQATRFIVSAVRCWTIFEASIPRPEICAARHERSTSPFAIYCAEDRTRAGRGRHRQGTHIDLAAYRELLEKIASAGMARLEMLDLDEMDLEGAAETVDDEVARRRLADAVAEAMEKLPQKLLHVLALYYQEGCTLREIGAVLGVGESRVSQLHTEAIHRLRASVGRE